MDSKQQIMVLDDDVGILDSFGAMLGDDYHVVLVNNGLDALKLMENEIPGLIFLDIKMPGTDGIDILQMIRSKGYAIPVVVVTAMPQDRYRQKAERFGVYRYLSKPLDVDEIEDIARQVMVLQ